MRYKCIVEFVIQMCDDDCFMIDNDYRNIPIGSVWEVSDSNLLGGEVHLDSISGCEDFGWIEVPKEIIENNFIGY